ncbi:MAG: hypothetical protein ACRDBO_15050 [Lachnospiraceae bacterium]
MNQLWKRQASVAYGYSLTRLALNEYMYLEGVADLNTPDKIRKYDQQFHQILELHTKNADCLEQIKTLRSRLQQDMEIIIAMIDCFRVYEYAINRVERRFQTGMPVSGDTDEAFTARLLEYVTGTGDTAVMNQRVQHVIGQLPIRFTRQKFYSMVKEALFVYIGSDQSGLDNIMYLLRTGAMLGIDEAQWDEYPQMKEMLATLERLVFKTITAEEYQNAAGLILLAGEQLDQYSERYQLLQQMVNDLYVLQLTGSDAVRNNNEEQSALSLLKLLLYQYQNIAAANAEDEILDYLHQLEGIQEQLYEKYQRLEGAPEYREGEEIWADKSRRVELLMSTSPFADLELRPAEKGADRLLVDQTAEAFIGQLDTLFAACQKPVMRAVMASVLSSLPICFNSLEDIRSYIKNSLAGCSDPAEKDACRELLQLIMESESYALV